MQLVLPLHVGLCGQLIRVHVFEEALFISPLLSDRFFWYAALHY